MQRPTLVLATVDSYGLGSQPQVVVELVAHLSSVLQEEAVAVVVVGDVVAHVNVVRAMDSDAAAENI